MSLPARQKEEHKRIMDIIEVVINDRVYTMESQYREISVIVGALVKKITDITVDEMCNDCDRCEERKDELRSEDVGCDPGGPGGCREVRTYKDACQDCPGLTIREAQGFMSRKLEPVEPAVEISQSGSGVFKLADGTFIEVGLPLKVVEDPYKKRVTLEERMFEGKSNNKEEGMESFIAMIHGLEYPFAVINALMERVRRDK